MAASPAVSAGRIAKTDALRHGQALFALGSGDCAVHGATRLHTIVNTAVPAMAASLQVTAQGLKAVVTSYILSLAV